MSKAYCYCRVKCRDLFMLWCSKCSNYFHPGCLKSGVPSPLAADVFFNFICSNCRPEEQCTRMKMQWIHVILLSMYNLQLQSNGRKGYYKWKQHICGFIDKHWKLFFGVRKKSNTWHGTVAGALSGGHPEYFKSGATDLKESGWWALSDKQFSCAYDIETIIKNQYKNKPKRESPRLRSESLMKVSTLRTRSGKPIFQPVEKRTSTQQTKRNRKSTPTLSSKTEENTDSFSWVSSKLKKEPSEVSVSEASTFDWSHCDESTDSWFTEKDLKPDETLPQCLLKDDEEEEMDEIDIEPVSPIRMSDTPEMEDIISASESKDLLTPQQIKSEPMDIENCDSKTNDDSINFDQIKEFNIGRKKRKASDQESEEHKEGITFCQPVSVYEENSLLNKLDSMLHAVANNPEARRLRRKLYLRKEKREWNVPILDIDSIMVKAHKVTLSQQQLINSMLTFNSSLPVSSGGESRILDRYQLKGCRVQNRSRQHPSFLSRLIGRDENHLEGIMSPYTSRILKPFIWRDYETMPCKLKLLQEIIAHSHRNDPSWKPLPRASVDYSYVRPDHIPSINALCQEFYWPGIDLSECLQHPDFSCVALYKWLIIGFAFMVPDVKWNEAYISFVFTHPEWRRAGIATFMIYHLLQTCMGKDITLHVSATNPALFLYQKFGFKLEEFVLDFYDKYYPEDSRECKHAFFLRLSH